MRFVRALALLLASATAPGAATSPRAAAASDAGRLVGAWQCTGPVPGSFAKEVYVRTADTAIALKNDVHTARGLSGVVRETFVYDPDRGGWSLHAGSNAFFDEMRLAAGAWTENEWTFVGTQSAGRANHRIRIVYASLGTDAFRREHQTQVGNDWKEDGQFLCRRTPVPRPPVRLALAPPRAPEPVHDASHDRAYALEGVWSCETRGGAAAVHTYARLPDGNLRLHNALQIAGRTYGIDEVYRFDRATDTWENRTQGDAFVGKAPAWRGERWTFEGSVPRETGRTSVRMVYASLGNGRFRRDFSERKGATWQPFASEICRRR